MIYGLSIDSSIVNTLQYINIASQLLKATPSTHCVITWWFIVPQNTKMTATWKCLRMALPSQWDCLIWGWFATHSCAERGHIKRLLRAISQETFLWHLIEVSRICWSESLIVASGANHLLLPVCHGWYLGTACSPPCSWSGGGGAYSCLHPMSPPAIWATLFLSRKPESNGSHMSVITVESDETLMSHTVFPSLSFCVSFYPFFILL